MKFPELIPAILDFRRNRFTADVVLSSGEKAQAYVPTTGRLTGVLYQGGRVWLQPAVDRNRKLAFTLVMAELEQGGLCSVHAALASQLFEEALLHESLESFLYSEIQREVTCGNSRLDFRLSNREDTCWVEVKSVTYAQDGVGMFPDAPIPRRSKHLQELAELAAHGDRASVVFIAQRDDVTSFKPYEAIDPEFAAVLRQVHSRGVEIRVYRCDLSLEKVEIAEEIPVVL